MTTLADTIRQNLIHAIEGRWAPRPGAAMQFAPNGKPYVTIQTAGFSDEETAFRALVMEWEKHLVTNPVSLDDDTVWWRVKPYADHANSNSKKFGARMRLAIGRAADEKPEYVPDETGHWPGEGERQNVKVLRPAAASAAARDSALQSGGINTDPPAYDAATAGVILPSWRCHKVVQAAKITGMQFPPEGPVICMGDISAKAAVTPKDLARMVGMTKPEPGDGEAWANLVGGYYVRYEDGYESWSPAKAFEDGYSLVDATETENPLGAGILALEKLAVLEFERNWPRDELHQRIRRICRQMACAARYSGPDYVDRAVYGFPPDRLATINNHAMVAQHGGGIVPAWATYYPEVRAVMDADANSTNAGA